MGYYIDHNSKGVTLNSMYKAKQLIEDGAVEVEPKWQENLICVASNPLFDAAIYCHNEAEFDMCKFNDGRYKIWLTHPLAKKLSGYEK